MREYYSYRKYSQRFTDNLITVITNYTVLYNCHNINKILILHKQGDVDYMDYTKPLGSIKDQILKDIFHHEISFNNFLQCPSWCSSTPFHGVKNHAIYSPHLCFW